MTKQRILTIGSSRALDGALLPPFTLPSHHLVTHGFITGMTGSGKTGFLMVLVEEALRSDVPVLMIDVKGDLPNLLLAFPDLSAAALVPWVEPAPGDARTAEELAEQLATERAEQLRKADIGPAQLAAFRAKTHIRVITPGSSAGERLHVLSSLERRSPRWDTDPESARAALSAAVSLVLRLLGRDPDPARSKDHVLLALLAERRLLAGADGSLGCLLADLNDPPITRVGALELDHFMSRADRRALAAALNTLLASPSFATWREGVTLDIARWLAPTADGRTAAVILSVAHLDDDERALVLGVVLEEALSWMRGLCGTRHLRALLVLDEVYGLLPPHPANPPTKRPLVAMMKQARAFGVGVLVATQNPMDVDYRALGNAGLWCVGRLQTDADRERVVDGLAGAGGHGALSKKAVDGVLKKLGPRWFVVRDVHGDGVVLVKARWAMSFLRGPMTGAELRQARGDSAPGGGCHPSPTSVPW